MNVHLSLIGTAAIGLAFGLLIASPSAEADTIILGSSKTSISFTGKGAGTVSVSMPMLTGTAFLSDLGVFGSYTFGSTTFSAGPEVGGIFSAGLNSEKFTFKEKIGPDILMGLIKWSLIEGGTSQATFIGTLTITSIAGDAAFKGNFPTKFANVDFTTNPMHCALHTDCSSLIALADHRGATATATISSGEVAPVPVPVVGAGLPGMMLACGSLLALARRRRNRAALI